MNPIQVSSGASNVFQERPVVCTGKRLNSIFTVYGINNRVVILTSRFERQQVIQTESNDFIHHVACNSTCSKIACCIENKIHFLMEDQSNTGAWRTEKIIDVDSFIQTVSFSNDGSMLIVATTTQLSAFKLTIIDGRLHELLLDSHRLDERVEEIMFSPDDQYFSTFSKGLNVCKIWYDEHRFFRKYAEYYGVGLEKYDGAFTAFCKPFSLSFIFLPHPCPVSSAQWRNRTGIFLNSSFKNVLMTCSVNGVARIWLEYSWWNPPNTETCFSEIFTRQKVIPDDFCFLASVPYSASFKLVTSSIVCESIFDIKDAPPKLYWLNNKDAEFEVIERAVCQIIDEEMAIRTNKDNGTELFEDEESSLKCIQSTEEIAPLVFSSSIGQKLIHDWARDHDIVYMIYPNGDIKTWALQQLDCRLLSDSQKITLVQDTTIPSILHFSATKTLVVSYITHAPGILDIFCKSSLLKFVRYIIHDLSISKPDNFMDDAFTVAKPRILIEHNTFALTAHRDGSMNMWKIDFKSHDHSSICSISRVAYSDGSRFNVSNVRCSPSLPLIITTHHMYSKGYGKTEGDKDCSELVIWWTKPLNSILISNYIIKIKQISSTNPDDYRYISWLPLFNDNSGSQSVASCVCFATNTLEGLAIYKIVVDGSQTTHRSSGNLAGIEKSDCWNADALASFRTTEVVPILILQHLTILPGYSNFLHIDFLHCFTDFSFDGLSDSFAYILAIVRDESDSAGSYGMVWKIDSKLVSKDMSKFVSKENLNCDTVPLSVFSLDLSEFCSEYIFPPKWIPMSNLLSSLSNDSIVESTVNLVAFTGSTKLLFFKVDGSCGKFISSPSRTIYQNLKSYRDSQLHPNYVIDLVIDEKNANLNVITLSYANAMRMALVSVPQRIERDDSVNNSPRIHMPEYCFSIQVWQTESTYDMTWNQEFNYHLPFCDAQLTDNEVDLLLNYRKFAMDELNVSIVWKNREDGHYSFAVSIKCNIFVFVKNNFSDLSLNYGLKGGFPSSSLFSSWKMIDSSAHTCSKLAMAWSWNGNLIAAGDNEIKIYNSHVEGREDTESESSWRYEESFNTSKRSSNPENYETQLQYHHHSISPSVHHFSDHLALQFHYVNLFGLWMMNSIDQIVLILSNLHNFLTETDMKRNNRNFQMDFYENSNNFRTIFSFNELAYHSHDENSMKISQVPMTKLFESLQHVSAGNSGTKAKLNDELVNFSKESSLFPQKKDSHVMQLISFDLNALYAELDSSQSPKSNISESFQLKQCEYIVKMYDTITAQNYVSFFELEILKSFVKSFWENVKFLEENSGGMDQLSKKFLTLVTVHLGLMENLQSSKSFMDEGKLENLFYCYIYSFALHSESQYDLLNCLKSSISDCFSWKKFSMIGFVWWVDSNEMLISLIENVAKCEFQKSKDPLDCAMFYILIGKRSILSALCRTKKHPEMAKFFTRDFSDLNNKRASLKNAYKLIGTHRYVHSVAFLLLANCIDEAVEVCVERMNDLSLAYLVVRFNSLSNLSDSVSNNFSGNNHEFSTSLSILTEKPSQTSSVSSSCASTQYSWEKFVNDALRKCNSGVSACLKHMVLWHNKRFDEALSCLSEMISADPVSLSSSYLEIGLTHMMKVSICEIFLHLSHYSHLQSVKKYLSPKILTGAFQSTAYYLFQNGFPIVSFSLSHKIISEVIKSSKISMQPSPSAKLLCYSSFITLLLEESKELPFTCAISGSPFCMELVKTLGKAISLLRSVYQPDENFKCDEIRLIFEEKHLINTLLRYYIQHGDRYATICFDLMVLSFEMEENASQSVSQMQSDHGNNHNSSAKSLKPTPITSSLANQSLGLSALFPHCLTSNPFSFLYNLAEDILNVVNQLLELSGSPLPSDYPLLERIENLARNLSLCLYHGLKGRRDGLFSGFSSCFTQHKPMSPHENSSHSITQNIEETFPPKESTDTNIPNSPPHSSKLYSNEDSSFIEAHDLKFRVFFCEIYFSCSLAFLTRALLLRMSDRLSKLTCNSYLTFQGFLDIFGCGFSNYQRFASNETSQTVEESQNVVASSSSNSEITSNTFAKVCRRRSNPGMGSVSLLDPNITKDAAIMDDKFTSQCTCNPQITAQSWFMRTTSVEKQFNLVKRQDPFLQKRDLEVLMSSSSVSSKYTKESFMEDSLADSENCASGEDSKKVWDLIQVGVLHVFIENLRKSLETFGIITVSPEIHNRSRLIERTFSLLNRWKDSVIDRLKSYQENFPLLNSTNQDISSTIFYLDEKNLSMLTKSQEILIRSSPFDPVSDFSSFKLWFTLLAAESSLTEVFLKFIDHSTDVKSANLPDESPIHPSLCASSSSENSSNQSSTTNQRKPKQRPETLFIRDESKIQTVTLVNLDSISGMCMSDKNFALVTGGEIYDVLLAEEQSLKIPPESPLFNFKNYQNDSDASCVSSINSRSMKLSDTDSEFMIHQKRFLTDPSKYIHRSEFEELFNPGTLQIYYKKNMQLPSPPKKVASFVRLPYYVAALQDLSLVVYQFGYERIFKTIPRTPSEGMLKNEKVCQLRFNSSGSRLGLLTESSWLSLYSVDDMNAFREIQYLNIKTHAKSACDFAFLNSSTFFSTVGSSNGTHSEISLWDTLCSPKSRLVHLHVNTDFPITSMLYDPTEMRIIAGGKRGEIDLFDLRQRRSVKCYTNSNSASSGIIHNSTIQCMALSGSRLAAGSQDGSIMIWSLKSDASLTDPYKLTKIHATNRLGSLVKLSLHAGVSSLSLSGNRLFSCGYDGTFRVHTFQ